MSHPCSLSVTHFSCTPEAAGVEGLSLLILPHLRHSPGIVLAALSIVLAALRPLSSSPGYEPALDASYRSTLNNGVGLTDDHSSNKLTGAKIIPLTAPDSDSNYSDWEYQMLTLLENYNVDYVLKPIQPEARPPNWERDNKAVCTLISQVVEPANFRYTKPNREDATKTWEALRTAHHDNSAGGRMYWLRKISTSKMESVDLLGHIDEVAKMAERLDSLITPDKPLTVDEIHATALINSVPNDWVSCMSSLLNKQSVSAEQVVQALKGELLRRKNHGKDDPISVSSAKPKPSDSKAGKNKNRFNRPPRDTSRHCDFCNVDGHDLNNCNNTWRILDEVKANQKSRTGLRLLPQISQEGLWFLLGIPVLTLNAMQKSRHQQLPPSPIFL
ncbi:hypothetical protein PCANC_09979 [Puccinia coronata f. sp. avenae]|uniref:Uncharacterized protein n=1 Tax=Puccinia coronata f. sp. avenae TaxID=200324 RepID=A0A2N5T149_9BASI|nr:hypothetical protein PCANC_09979 [Puccinia coronata f. sp. avenae]